MSDTILYSHELITETVFIEDQLQFVNSIILKNKNKNPKKNCEIYCVLNCNLVCNIFRFASVRLTWDSRE